MRKSESWWRPCTNTCVALAAKLPAMMLTDETFSYCCDIASLGLGLVGSRSPCNATVVATARSGALFCTMDLFTLSRRSITWLIYEQFSRCGSVVCIDASNIKENTHTHTRTHRGTLAHTHTHTHAHTRTCTRARTHAEIQYNFVSTFTHHNWNREPGLAVQLATGKHY